MTEEKSTKTIEESVPGNKETIRMTGASIPPEGGNITPVDNNRENNSLATQDENYPIPYNTDEKTLHVEQSKDARTLTAEELKSKRYQSGLTVEEAKRLEDLEAQNNGEGVLKDKGKDDIPYRNRDPYKLEEGDIIEVMYKGLLKDIMVVDAWASKHMWHGYDKMLHSIDKRREEKKAEKDAEESSKKLAEKENYDLKAAHDKKQEEIKVESEQELKKVKKISQAINKGTLFDKENKDLLSEFEKIKKDTKGKEIYETVKQTCETKKDDKEAREKMAKEFFVYSAGTVWFNCMNKTAANDMAYAEVSHRSKHEKMNAQQMEREFNSANVSYEDHIQKTTAKEQQEAKEKISKSSLLEDKVLSKINPGELYDNCASKTRGLKKMAEKATDYADMNAHITERNPYVNGVRHMTEMPKLPEKNNVFRGGTLKDAVNYMKELRHDTLQTTSTNDYRTYLREQTGNHIKRLKSAQSNDEIIKKLRDRNGGR